MLKHFGDAFFEHPYFLGSAVVAGELAEPARRFVHVFEGEAERPVVHGDKPFRFHVVKNFHGFVGAHVDVAKGFGAIRADGQHGNFRREVIADLFEAVEVRAVAGVINFAALMFEHESAVTAMIVTQRPCAPMFARRERHLPIAMRKTFPPIQLDDALETEIAREITHAPGHHSDFRVRQLAQARLVKMIEVRVREQHEIDGREMLDAQAGAFDALEEKKPIRKIRVDEDVEIGELHEERRMANPRQGDLAARQFGKDRLFMLPGSRRQKSLPNHLAKKRAGIEGFGRSQIFEGTGQFPALARRTDRFNVRFRHKLFVIKVMRRVNISPAFPSYLCCC